MQGMEYLHKSALGVHGRLRSSSCLLNRRWSLKITDVGLAAYRVKTYITEDEEYTGMITYMLV